MLFEHIFLLKLYRLHGIYKNQFCPADAPAKDYKTGY
jgi:hypothetical protein